MIWRFRKSFKVIPGLRLNLSGAGISATVGASPLTVNVGPRGIYGTASIPGTGLSFRERLGSWPDRNQSQPPQRPGLSETPLPAADALEIRSASTEMLVSNCFRQLRDVLGDIRAERAIVTGEIVMAGSEAAAAAQQYSSWKEGFLLKHLFRRSFKKRQIAAQLAGDKLKELQEQLRLTVLALQIDIEPSQAEPYFRMRDAFAALSKSSKIWDTLSERQVNRTLERSAASFEVSRKEVKFSLGHCDLMDWEHAVPYLPNRTGGELFLYPGFAVYRSSDQAFALIDFREIDLESSTVQVIDDEGIPSDALVIGQTWLKCNKDGSQDRRFSANRQIPVLRYGVLNFKSASGLHEEFQVSNLDLAENFAGSWRGFQASLLHPREPRKLAASDGM